MLKMAAAALSATSNKFCNFHFVLLSTFFFSFVGHAFFVLTYTEHIITLPEDGN